MTHHEWSKNHCCKKGIDVVVLVHSCRALVKYYRPRVDTKHEAKEAKEGRLPYISMSTVTIARGHECHDSVNYLCATIIRKLLVSFFETAFEFSPYMTIATVIFKTRL